MNLAERGLYRELLDECWAEGSIPSNLDDLAEIANCTRAEIEAAWPALVPSFTERPDGRLVNDKIARVLLAQMEALARQRDGGRRGGQKRIANLKAALSQPQATKQIKDTATARTAALEAAPSPASNGASNPDSIKDLHGAPFVESPPACPHCIASVDTSGKRVRLLHGVGCPSR